MSQIIEEVKSGTPQTFPFPWMLSDVAEGNVMGISEKTNEYRSLWKELESYDPNPIKETSTIANFAQSNYLESHVENDPVLLHGSNKYEPWDSDTHVSFAHNLMETCISKCSTAFPPVKSPYTLNKAISLVVCSWNGPTDHHGIIQEFDTTHCQPFKEIIILENPHTNMRNNLRELPMKSAHVQVRERVGADVIDICNVPVETDWFFYTNVYHRVANTADLLFSQDAISKPLVPYTPADSVYCTDYEACTETLRLAREIYPEMDKIILIPYHTPSRDAFCEYWKTNYGENGELLKEREQELQLRSLLTCTKGASPRKCTVSPMFW